LRGLPQRAFELVGARAAVVRDASDGRAIALLRLELEVLEVGRKLELHWWLAFGRVGSETVGGGRSVQGLAPFF
jgi:hypothetical protein